MKASSATAPARVLLPGFSGTTLPDWVATRLDGGLAGVCLFGDNIADPRELRSLTDDIVSHHARAVIALDEEGGDVTRLWYAVGSPTPGNAWLGRYGDEQYTFDVAAAIATRLRDLGCNLNFAPTVDVNSNPDNPVIGVRSFSSDPGVAARHAHAWVRGHQGAGVGVSAKHFPGHGDTHNDSHLTLPVVDADLDTALARDLPPFQAAIDAGAWTIMTSHILWPAIDGDRPATFSPAILRGLLRDRLGFTGVVVSDALDMAGASARMGIPEAAVRALLGGCDLLCIGSHNTEEQLDDIERAIREAVTSGRLPEGRLADAEARVSSLGEMVAAHRAPPPGWLDRRSSFPDPQVGANWGRPAVPPAQVGANWGRPAVPPAHVGANWGRPAVPPAQVGANVREGTDKGSPPSLAAEGFGKVALRRAASIFAISARGARLLADPAEGGWLVVQLQTTPSMAVGAVPWGPAAARPQSCESDRVRIVVAGESTAREWAIGPAARRLALVGRDNHRHAWTAALVDEVRSSRPDTLVVEMGWPGSGRDVPDVATFGASRLLGAALLELLDPHSHAPTDERS
jgi:beta-N-acetylhexosaminidase